MFFHHFASSASDTATRCTACPSHFSVLSVRFGNARRSPRTLCHRSHHSSQRRCAYREATWKTSIISRRATHTVMSCPTASTRKAAPIAGQRCKYASSCCHSRPVLGRELLPASKSCPSEFAQVSHVSKVDIPLSPAALPDFLCLVLIESQRKDARVVSPKPSVSSCTLKSPRISWDPKARDTKNNGLGQVVTNHTFGSHPAIGRDGNSH